MSESTPPGLVIGSRGSDLALWQSRYVAAAMEREPAIRVIKTQGDKIQHLSLDKVEGKGFFTKEIEEALLAGTIDIAVHSFKDLPIEAPPGLGITAVPTRAPVRDVIVRRRDDAAATPMLWGLREGAKVGTSSLRRKAHLLSRRPDLTMVDIRGNVPTRFARVTSGDLDAVVLAEAGLTRLGMDQQAADQGVILVPIDVSDVCPAPAQGALAIQTRLDDQRAATALSALHHINTAACVYAERLLLGEFGGGCHLPLGAHCQSIEGKFRLTALVASPDGQERFEADVSGSTPELVAQEAHRELVSQGAEVYL